MIFKEDQATNTDVPKEGRKEDRDIKERLHHYKQGIINNEKDLKKITYRKGGEK